MRGLAGNIFTMGHFRSNFKMNGSRGFTFIELMVATLLIAIVSTAGLESLARFYKMIIKGTTRIVELNYAREKMEDIYMDDYATLAGGSDTAPGITSRTWTILDKTTYKVITVTVQKN